MGRIMSGLWPTKPTGIIIALLVVLMAVLALNFAACANTTAVPASTIQGSSPAIDATVPSCCQPSASGVTQPSCCGTSGPVTTTKPAARPGCCGG